MSILDNDIVIAKGKRTAICRLMGSFAHSPVDFLASNIISNLTTDIDRNAVSEIIFGHVLSGGMGQNPVRKASIDAGISHTVPAYSINQVCGSSMKAIILGCRSIAVGDSNIVIAGGMENMSMVSHAVYVRDAKGKSIKDMMVSDGLEDIFTNIHMGMTAENLAKKHGISRKEQDDYAYISQVRAKDAVENNKFKEEILPIDVDTRKGVITIDKDEHIRFGINREDLDKLRPAFKSDGSVTAGNSSGINDGCCAVMLMRGDIAKSYGLEIMGKIVGYGEAGVDPQYMGEAPIYASRKALKKAGWDISDVDLVESNEAFAVQAIAVQRELNIDMEKMNVNGGAIALGHPLAVSGARITTTLLHEMKRQNKEKGLATICIGGGMGLALCVQLC